jgi:hypothetical protein
MMMITDFVPPQPAALPVSPKSVIATKKMKFLILKASNWAKMMKEPTWGVNAAYGRVTPHL